MGKRKRSNNRPKKSDDRLSSLPDSLLCHILSFLPTELSVATSILAKRYRSLWTNVVTLDFDENKYTSKYSWRIPSFADSVNRIMLLRNDKDINTFRLILNDKLVEKEWCLNRKGETIEVDVETLDTWIRTTVARNVQTLDINLRHKLCLPRRLFSCKTLVDLRLHNCGPVPDSSTISLPNLKKLHLDCFRFKNDDRLYDLISGCPVLEELKIDKIIENDLKSCTISSPTIKLLTLNLDMSGPREFDFWDYKLVINTPEARYLVLEDHISQRISTGTFNSLVEANICLNNDVVKDGFVYSIFLLELVDNVSQVKSLRLSSSYKLETKFAAATSRFIHLTKLELAADWTFLLKFLESADNLQILIIEEADDYLKHWTEPKQVPMCLSSHLKQVSIHSFGYSEDEYKLVSYIMRNGKVLNMMDITGQEKEDDESVVEAKSNALRRISDFERQSLTCKLQFS